MAQPVIQSSYNSGEWAPHLWARVDISKFHSGAAVLENFFVDYRGGASTRVGTKYVLAAFNPSQPVRLIPFQASISIGFVLEFGEHYIRFHRNGAPVLEAGIAITGATKANPCVVSVVNTWSVGDWVFISGVGGMTQLNGKYYKISARSGTTITLQDLFGNAVDSTGFGAYTAGGTAARVFTLASPYAGPDLAMLKFCQNVNTLFLCHPSYAPYQLVYTSATSWSINPVTFGSQVSAPTNPSLSTTLAVATTPSSCYAYIVTAVDSTGQESAPSATARLNFIQDIRTTVGTNTLIWTGVAGAASYNVYKSDVNINNPVPDGVPFGFIGNCTGSIFTDSNIAADFSQGPPVPQNPFAPGSSVQSVTITAVGSYTAYPTTSFTAPPSGTTATGVTILGVATATPAAGGTGFVVGDIITLGNNTILRVLTLSGSAVATAGIVNQGVYNSALPATPMAQTTTSGAGTGSTFNLTWDVTGVAMSNHGSGYLTPPTVSFSAGAATATAVLGPNSTGNPSVPAFFQQRFVLAATLDNPQLFTMSRTAAPFNFDIHNPVEADDAITGTIVSGQLNNIKALVPQPGGLIVLTDGSSFLVNGGGQLGGAVSPSNVTSNAQSFLGCNDMPPIVSNFDILYVQSKGSSVRDASYNFYANVFTGTDISVIASHLFFGYQLKEWAWAEEPYKLVWAVRNDGVLLSLTFLKEQEFTAWTHHTTSGLFKSTASIVEAASAGYQNFAYFVVQRTVEGQTFQYIEYMPERIYTNGVQDAVCVDCAYQYSGSAVTSFSGATALAGLTVTGLADGQVITSFVMPADGSFTLGVAAAKVTVGLAFTAKLQTLPLDTGDPTIQSKMKKLPVGTVRVTETLGLEIGTSFANAVPMKDLVRGNVGSMTNQVVTDLVTGDAQTILDPLWQEFGTLCIQQRNPFPASVLGLIPELYVGDTAQ